MADERKQQDDPQFAGQQPAQGSNEGMFSGDDQQSDDLTEGRNHGATIGNTGMGGSPPSGAPGYGDQGPAGQGGQADIADQNTAYAAGSDGSGGDGAQADRTGGTSVTGEQAAQGEEADMSDVDFESDMEGDRGTNR